MWKKLILSSFFVLPTKLEILTTKTKSSDTKKLLKNGKRVKLTFPLTLKNAGKNVEIIKQRIYFEKKILM